MFEFDRDVLVEDNSFMHVVGAWFIPKAHNQGGLDCVLLCKIGERLVLRFIQVTIQIKHKIKLEYMRVFLESLNAFRVSNNLPPVVCVEVVVMVPDDLAEQAVEPTQWLVLGSNQTRETRNTTSDVQIALSGRVAGFKLTK